MGLFSKQFIDAIEWDERPVQLAWRVPMEDNEIQYGANLTVREGQQAVPLNNGKLRTTFSRACTSFRPTRCRSSPRSKTGTRCSSHRSSRT
ncbi:MAG: SPFH domain-containing protein [Erythrobacter sp.]|nr:SPFH domain-containing protein [Erythrobacter sp.]